MIKAMMMVAIMALNNTQVATVVETYNDVMLVETQTGGLHEYEFDGMTDRQKNAETVILVGDRVVVIK